MRLCLVRWRGRAALLAMLCAFAGAAAAGLDDGPKKDAPAKPEEKNPLIEEAGKLLLQGKVEDAQKKLDEAKKNDKDLPPARLMLARLMMRIRDYQPRVHAAIELAIKENPDHPVCFLDNASLALNEGRVTDAILNCERALQLATAGKNWTPKQKKDATERAHATMAAAYEAREDWEAARNQLQALLAKDMEPTNPQYRARLAQALFFIDPAGKESEARAELRQAIADDLKAQAAKKAEGRKPTLEAASVSLARFWARKGDNAKARERYEEAVKADPKDERAHIAYSDFLMQQNDFDRAKLEIEEAAKLKPDDAEVMKFQGLLCRVQKVKDYPKAEEVFKKILDKNPDDTYSRNQLALVQADQASTAKQTQAIQNAELNVKANQKAPDAWATLAYVYYKAGNIGEAQKALQQALSASNGQMSADMAYFVALILQDGDREKAKAILKEATSVSTKGLFVYKQEATDLYNKLEKLPPGTSSSSNK
jgi:tetratricopeptide (TPR) repeat protein